MEDFFDAIRKGDANTASRMMETQPELLRARDQRGSTPLILAAYYDRPEIVSLLLDKGAGVDEKDAAGNTALMGVCFKGYCEVAEILIKAGADVNIKNSMGANCLIFAITFNRVDMAKLLIAHGADPMAKDARGNTALDHARIQGLKPLVELLEQL